MNFRRSIIIVQSYGGLKSQVEKIDFLTFLEKQPLTEKFSKFCSERIHSDTDWRVVFKFCEIWQTGIGKIVHMVRARKWIQYSAEAQLRAE